MQRPVQWPVETNCAVCMSICANWMTEDRRTYSRSGRTGPNRKGAVPRDIKKDVTVRAF